MLTTLRKAEYFELTLLFFIQGMAMSTWFVPLGSILDAHGMHGIKPFAFAATALAAFVSPLMFGAMADRHVAPARVLRWLAVATAVMLTLVSTAIKFHASAWLVLALIQLMTLCNAPMLSISSTIIFARLAHSNEFAPMRVMLTFGWMAGGVLASLLNADTSSLAGYTSAIIWLVLAAFTFFLPKLEVPKSAENLSWHERLGLDALTLLKNRDTRVVFITVMLLNIPLAAFYPYAPTNLRDLGLRHTSAWMSLGAMFGGRRNLQPGLAAAALADEMDFRLRPRVWRAAVRLERGQHRNLPAHRHRAAWRVVRAGLYHRANLPRTTRGHGHGGRGRRHC